MFLTRISVMQPVFATMVMVAIVVFGLTAYSNLPVEEFPDVEFPIVAVQTTYSGASPEAVETNVSQVIEEAVNTLAGIDTVSSTSSPGFSLIIVQFTLETDSVQAAQEVRDRISGLTLPDDAGQPLVVRFDPTATPMISLALSSGTQSMVDLTRMARDVVSPALTNLEGVGSATIVGGLDEQVDILIDPARLNAYNIGVSEVISALSQDNITIPAGEIVDGVVVQSIQLNTEFGSVDDFASVVVTRAGGEIVTLGDVATISLGESESDGLALHNGEQALAINVFKIDGGNTVAVAHEVRALVDRLAAGTQLGDARIDILQDSSVQIENNFGTVRSTLIEGAVLAVAIVFLFLNSWRSTVITGLTLPISILGTLAVISALGFTLNTMTMLALTLSIGILIDDAIVVRENITRHLHMGKSHFQAALDGTNEIGFAVLATTLSICAVFLPLAFMDGIVGQFFLQFGVTVSVAVLISLFVSFTLDPMLSSVWYDPDAHPEAKRGPIGRVIARFDHGFERLGGVYKSVLGWALRRRIVTLLMAAVLFVSSFFLVPFVGFEFLPAADNGQVTVSLETPVGSSQNYTLTKARQVEAIVSSFDVVESTYVNVNSGTANGENAASVVANLVPIADRSQSDVETLAILRDALVVIPGVDITMSTAGGVTGGAPPISLNLRGGDIDTLSEVAIEVAAVIAGIDGTTDVRMSAQQAQPMLDIVVDRQAASDMGISVQQIGIAMRAMIAGEVGSEWTDPNDNRIDVVVRLPEQQRRSVEGLLDLPVAQQRGGAAPIAVPLGQVAQLVETFGPNEIEREGLARQVSVTANVAGRVLGDIVADIDAAMATLDLPDGIEIVQSGDAEMLSDTMDNMGAALALAVVFIYLVLASQFGSFLQPIAIMMALPMALVGVMLGLIVGGSTLNMYSMIGFIMLMGLVVKNAILLVDNANQRVREGMVLREALIAAGGTRFRPIIMTTLAMIFGMLPLALALHPGSSQNAPMAHAVIGGLISSTLLTLLVVPVMLTFVDGFARWVRPFLPKAPDDDDSKSAAKAP